MISNPATTQASAESAGPRGPTWGMRRSWLGQHLYVINPPGVMSFMAGLFQRLFTDKPFPASINYLSSGFAPVHIQRVDAQTILVTPQGGYTPLPGPIVDDKTGTLSPVGLENVYRALDGFYYNPRKPMQAGQVVILNDVTVQVTEMTRDGRIAQAAFTFAHPLEEDRYVWLLWDEGTSTYARVRMPPVGESLVYP